MSQMGISIMWFCCAFALHANVPAPYYATCGGLQEGESCKSSWDEPGICRLENGQLKCDVLKLEESNVKNKGDGAINAKDEGDATVGCSTTQNDTSFLIIASG